jgi:hypothetical protein
MALLAERAGLALSETVDDSSEFQFAVSECYQRDIPIFDGAGRPTSRAREIHTAEQIAQFATRAAELNARGRGDQAMFVLRQQARRRLESRH